MGEVGRKSVAFSNTKNKRGRYPLKSKYCQWLQF